MGYYDTIDLGIRHDLPWPVTWHRQDGWCELASDGMAVVRVNDASAPDPVELRAEAQKAVAAADGAAAELAARIGDALTAIDIARHMLLHLKRDTFAATDGNGEAIMYFDALAAALDEASKDLETARPVQALMTYTHVLRQAETAVAEGV